MTFRFAFQVHTVEVREKKYTFISKEVNTEKLDLKKLMENWNKNKKNRIVEAPLGSPLGTGNTSLKNIDESKTRGSNG